MLAGCTATKSNPEVLEPVEEVPVPQEVQTPAEEPEIIIPEPEPIVPEPEPELEPVVQELTPEEQEFLRSTKALNEECTSSIDTFTKDKKELTDFSSKQITTVKIKRIKMSFILNRMKTHNIRIFRHIKYLLIVLQMPYV